LNRFWDYSYLKVTFIDTLTNNYTNDINSKIMKIFECDTVFIQFKVVDASNLRYPNSTITRFNLNEPFCHPQDIYSSNKAPL